MSCKWVASDRPRVVSGRHGDNCPGYYDPTQGERIVDCAGCQPCSEPHCRICGVAHADGTCAECLAETRANLREIARLCGALSEEVEVRGVEGEAMMLLGPSADPEARGHLEASVAAGRVSPDYLADAIGETHPVWVLGTWDMLWRDALDHDTADGVTLAGAVDYIDRTMSYMAGYEHVPFEDFARDLRRCAGHLEAVLHDGEQRDEGVPCLRCERPLTRVWGADEKRDGWECQRCRVTSTEAQYQLAVKADYIRRAEWLTDVDMVTRFAGEKLTPATVRSWASDKLGRPATVRKRRHTERTEFRVADVEARLAQRDSAA